ncbi:MAG: SDR family NAD(P)-dependent oxidoreductase [Elusimicrobiota bacterium]|jgi:acyl transferase domain-containing protein/NAD(P)-dependent dehydrogenase (short-subunit alcohol dehydrogenase family)/acyl carrier protein
MSQPSKPSLEPIAIIGLGGIFPDAADIPTYWKNILAKKNCISEVPADHWDWRLYYSEDRSAPDKTYSKIGGFVRGFHFDSLPLRIPPHVAKQMDVVQQFAVACTAEALRDAGYDKKNLDSSRTAVIFGNAMGGPKSEDSNLRVYTAKIRKHLLTSATLARLSSQEQEAVADEMVSSIKAGLLAITEDSMPGELSNVIAGRVANVFNLNGPNFTVDAACAASLAAVSQAVNGLRLGQFDMAVTGGIDQMMAPPAYVKFSKIGALSAEGSCPFDASADGFVMGEGAGVMVLKRVRDAVRDGDRIYALIRAIGASSDGRGKGITAPNPKGQKLAIERVFSQVDYVPADVGLLEAHGTSTKVGDVVEVQTASELFGSAPPRSIALGSVKSQIGHLKAAAGVASLIKTALAVHHKTLPPSINFKTPNPGIDWAHSPFFVPTEPAPWAAKDGKPRRAHVSAFGFGGTNFHVALEEATPQTLNWTPELPLAQADAAPVAACDPAALSTGTLPDALGGEVFFTCGKSPKEVLSKLKDLRGRVPAGGPLSALAREWNTHARSGSYVLNIAAESPEKLAQKLDLVLASKAELWEKTPPAFRPKAIHPSRRPAKKPKIAFMFPGQGLQYVDMLRDMAAKYAVVAETFREADEVMTPRIGKLTDILFSKPGESAEALAERQERMRQTEVTQPAVLTADIALLRLLRSYGVEADVVYGHSLGEYAALVAAGALEFKDALVTVSCRAKEIASIHVKDPGKMASISWPVSKVEPVLKDIPGYVVAANKNCPIQTVLAGESQAVEEAVSRFTALGAQAQLIEVSHAFHSNIMAPAREPYARFLKTIALKSPRIPVLANVNADFFPSEPDAMRDLMVLQMSSPVEFIRQTERLYEDGVRVFVELGPKRALTAFVQTTLEDKPDVQIFASNHPKRGGIQEFNDLLARLDAAGVPLDIDAAASKGLGHTPAYRAWLAAPSSGERTPGAAQESPAASAIAPSWDFYDGAVVVSGVAAGTPGSWEKVFREDNIDALLRGQNLISRLPDEESERQIDKSILRLIKSEDGNHRFERIQSAAEVVRLAALAGEFDLAKEFGFTDSLVHAMDSASRLAVAAGILALRDAGIPLLRTYKRTTLGGFLPSGWALPESLRAGTGVIFASAYANLGAMASEVASYLGDKYRGKPLRELSALIDELLTRIQDPQERESIQTWRDEHLRAYFDRFGSRQAPYEFSRDFLLRVMPLAHSQLMQWIGAKGPGMHLNAACASTTEAVGVAEDWIRLGRAERVIVIAGDDASGPDIREWMLSGFVAAGAATTAAVVSEAALPFDRRRHGMIVGMGAAGLVIERTESVQARGMRPLTELLASQYENSAFHATRLEPEHVAGVMERLVSKAERRRGVRRADIAAKALFMSHETYTPARGGSASAEVQALKRTFGPDAEKIVVTNTKGFHGHSMGASVEDPTAVRALTSGVLPPIANYRDPDPDLAGITLSRGGEYDLEYALRLAAGFGSQIAMTLMRRVLRKGESRIADPVRHKDWLKSVSGQAEPSLEVVQNTLRIREGAATSGNAVIPAKAGTQGMPSPVSSAKLDSGLRRNDEKAAPAAASSVSGAAGEDAVRAAVTALVSEKTGYPADMLQADLDMEADLGIDTVKQAELFGLIRERYGIPRKENLSLKDYPTLNHVVRFVLVNSSSSTQQTHPSVIPAEGNVVIPAKAGTAENVVIPAKAGTQGSPSAVSPAASLDSGFRRNDEKKSAAAPAPQKAPAPVGEDAVRAAVTALVSEKTGYPADMLEPDLDMEADLGIDTVKQAELLGLIREKYGIPRTENLSLKDYPTLRHVIRFVLENSSSSSTQQTHPSVIPAEGNVVIPAKAGTAENVVIPAKAGTQGAPSAVSPAASLDSGLRRNDDTVKAADPRFKRWVLQAGPRPANGEPVRLDPERAVLLLAADAEEAAPFAQAVIKAGGTPIILKAAEWKDAESAETSVRATLKGRKAQGLWDLTPLSHPADPKLTPASFDKSYRRSVRALFLAAKALREDLGKDSHVLSFTRMDGSHGLDEGKFHPLCGASTGLVKALRRELAGSRVQALDFDAQTSPESMAETALRELGSDDPRAEVGFLAGERRGLALRVKDLPEFAKRKIGSRSVVLITGGGQGLGAVLAREIARKTRCSIVVLGRTSLGKEATTWARMDAQEMKSLKQRMWEELKSDTARRATPALLEREFSKVSKAAEVHRNIEELCRLGSKASYIECDLSDAASTSKAVKEAVRLYHNIDVIIHAAGLDESRFLADKKPEDFDRVFRAKAHGAVHLLGCVPPIGAQLWVFFTSVVGRFGNAAQTDYAAANDFLAKLAHRMRAQRRLAVACDLSAFSEVGMATRGSVEAFLKSQGVEFMPPSVGMGMIYREMLSGDAGEVVLAGALGGMDSDKLMTSAPEETASEAAATPKGPRPLFDRIVREEAGKAVLGKNFSLESDPWLKDHSIGGTPYVPGVMGLELLAEAFRKLQGATPMELQDVRFSLPIKLLRSKPAVVRSIATVEGDHAQLLLESDFFNPAGIRLGEPRKHFTARAPLQAAGSDGWAGLQKSALPEDRSLVVEKKGIYILNFHGPRFQVLSGMLRLEEKELLAVYRRPSEHLWPKGEDRAFLFSPMIVEAAFQTCGFRDLHFDKHLSLPDSADRIQIWTHGPEPRELFVHAFYRGAEEKSRLYDAVVFDEELRVWARLSGYRMIVQS